MEMTSNDSEAVIGSGHTSDLLDMEMQNLTHFIIIDQNLEMKEKHCWTSFRIPITGQVHQWSDSNDQFFMAFIEPWEVTVDRRSSLPPDMWPKRAILENDADSGYRQELLGSWLRHCRKEHLFCSMSMEDDTLLPTRLINLEALSSSDTIFIQDTRGLHGK